MKTVHFNVAHMSARAAQESLCGVETKGDEYSHKHWETRCTKCNTILSELERDGVDLDNLEDY